MKWSIGNDAALVGYKSCRHIAKIALGEVKIAVKALHCMSFGTCISAYALSEYEAAIACQRYFYII